MVYNEKDAIKRIPLGHLRNKQSIKKKGIVNDHGGYII